MSKSTNHVPQPSIILFGLTSIGKPKAGAFKADRGPAARKAASKLGLQVLEIADESAPHARGESAGGPDSRARGRDRAIRTQGLVCLN